MYPKLTLFLFLLTLHVNLIAQQYWQQQTDYDIAVTLDDAAHTLTGTTTVEYTNNSPDALKEIYFHLWANAYAGNETAFSEQKLRSGSSKFYFATQEQFGSFTEIDFKTGGQSLSWSLLRDSTDIALVKLVQPLKTGEKITIAVPFTMDIPDSFSRLGHVGQSYQMTQWYPKPAVYDKDGWQAMPYLDQGEFYSEFGSFSVEITLPQNYVVGATGVLQTESERDFLQKKIAETDAYFAEYEKEMTKTSGQLRRKQAEADTFPPSSDRMKTILYTAEKVHDFAWFADKRFKVRKSTVELSNGKKVDTYVMFSKVEEHLWKSAVDYVDRSVKFYSEHVGNYPYPQMTAVQSALSAGGGMEYPMITVIGLAGDAKALDDVITHEVGHNWFYGILATNERIHPWMDEGMNSYYEIRYMREYYDGNRFELSDAGIPKFILNNTPYDAEQLGLIYQKCKHRAQAPDTDSDLLTGINYGLGAYSKPAIALRQAELWLGTETFDKAMQAYYEKYKFKHPTPADFRRTMEAETGKDWSWFTDGFMFSTKTQNYRITSVTQSENGEEYVVKIKNKGKVAAPFPLSGVKDDTVMIAMQWHDGFTGEKEFRLPKGDYKTVAADGNFETLEHDHFDNIHKTRNLFNWRKIGVAIPFGLENPRRDYLGIAPVAGYTVYDGVFAGLAFHNYRIPERPWTVAYAPTYSFGAKDLTGFLHFSYRFGLSEMTGSTLDWLELGAEQRSFHYAENFREEGEEFGFDRNNVYLKLRAENPRDNFYLTGQARWVNIREEVLNFADPENPVEDDIFNNYYEGSLHLEKRRVVNPWSLRYTVELGERQIFLDEQPYHLHKLEAKTAYTYKPGRNISFRLFTGVLFGDYRNRGSVPGQLTLTGQGYTGFNDYKYDDWYFGRNENEGLASQQITMRNGGFKVALPQSQASNGFTTNSLLIALNLKADLPEDLPLKLPLKPYFDIAYVQRNIAGAEPLTFSDQLWWSGGFAVEFGEVFGVYFPIINSENFEIFESDYRAKYFNRVTFRLNLQKLNPRRLTDRASF